MLHVEVRSSYEDIALHSFVYTVVQHCSCRTYFPQCVNRLEIVMRIIRVILSSKSSSMCVNGQKKAHKLGRMDNSSLLGMNGEHVGKRKNLISTDQPVVDVTPYFLCYAPTGLNQIFIKVCSGRLM